MAHTAIDQLEHDLASRRAGGELIGAITVADLNKHVTEHCEATLGAGWTNGGATKCDWQSNPPHFKDHYGPLADFVALQVEGVFGAAGASPTPTAAATTVPATNASAM